jgi:tetratricopeptide (TPR) repeat protein
MLFMNTRLLSMLQCLLLTLGFLLNLLPFHKNSWKLFWLACCEELKSLTQLTQKFPVTSATALLLIFFSFADPAQAQQANAETTKSESGASSAALSPELIQVRMEASAAIYNLDYATARTKFEEIRQRKPDHPAGDLYIATLIWVEHLYKSRRLQSSLYQNESFYAGADEAKEETEGDAVDQGVDRTFRDAIGRAKTKALTLVNRNRKDADALYFLGAVYGVAAAYDASVARKFIGALRNGSRCVDLHQQVIKLNPEYYDAYMSVGMYNYVVGSLPGLVKTLVAIGGVRGNKAKGITMVEQAAAQARFVGDDARVILAALYQNEKRPADAIRVLEEMSRRYPNNYLVRLETANTLAQLQRHDEASAIFEELLKKNPQALDLIHFQYAESLAVAGQHERAAEHFQAAAKTPKAENGLITYALLRTGQMNDLSGNRNEAIAQYKVVMTRPNVFDSRDKAEKGIKQPFKKP